MCLAERSAARRAVGDGRVAVGVLAAACRCSRGAGGDPAAVRPDLRGVEVVMAEQLRRKGLL